MIKLFCKLKRDKMFLSLVVVCAILFILDIALIIFDACELALISQKLMVLSINFVPLNIAVLALNFLGLIYIIIYFVIKNRTKIKVLDKK